MLSPVPKPQTESGEPERVIKETLETRPSEGIEASQSPARRLVVGTSDRPIAPPGGAITLESVIGLDERTRIVDTEDAPWRMICGLDIDGPWGNFVGTGWFVGPRTVITAGHCVYDRNQMGGWARKIVLRPGVDDGDEPFKAITATRFETTDKWLQDQNADFDIGVIHLEKADAIDAARGWFAVASFPDKKLQNHLVNVSGYPGDKGGRQQWWARNRVRGLSPRRIFYDVDTMGGQSGGPVFIIEKAGAAPKVVGIHAYGVGGSKPSSIKVEVNSAPRIIPEVVELIQGWIDKNGGQS